MLGLRTISNILVGFRFVYIVVVPTRQFELQTYLLMYY